MKKLNLLYTFMFVLFGTFLSGQVTDVNYQMKFDTATGRYDCYFIVNSGQATTVLQRIMLNTQYSIIVPTGDTLMMDTSYAPLIGNETYSSTTPVDWAVATIIESPAAQPESDFYSIKINSSATAQYNNLISGDTVKLFSVIVADIKDCSLGIRLYENGVDPNSSAPGMELSDFSQGFTMGGTPQQLYRANSTQVYPPKPLIEDMINTCSGGIEIDLIASTSTVQEPLTYEWEGPNGYSSTNEDVNISPSTPADNGMYVVTITDGYGCSTMDSILVVAKPDAGVDQTACAGDTKQLAGLPAIGTWTMLNTNTVGAGIQLLAGGTAQVDFDATATGTYYFEYEISVGGSPAGCTDTMEIFVNPRPPVQITGDNDICVGTTTELAPIVGGTWVSNAPAVAEVDANTGVVTALTGGTATFTFTNTITGCTATTDAITVNEQPVVKITESDTLCIDMTTLLTPGSGGVWTSTEPAIANVTNSGIVTALATGTAKMYFKNNGTECVSDTLTIFVTPKPVVTVPSNQICVNGTMTATVPPALGLGTWSSSDGNIATITNAGLILGIAPGDVTFKFTSLASTCESDPSEVVTVTPAPTVSIVGNPEICIETTIDLSPNNGGTWVANNPTIAEVDVNTGVVTGKSSGIATFTFTDAVTGCTNTTNGLIVDPRPTANSSQAAICIGNTTALNPSTGGTWQAVTPAIAELINGNLARGLTEGTAKFLFKETSSGCVSDTVIVEVEPGPVVVLTGPDDICVGFTTRLTPSTGGTWRSTDDNIATITFDGLVVGVSAGTVQFIFTSLSTLCESAPSDVVTVRARPVISIEGPTALCIGETSQLYPGVGGEWISTAPAVASVTDDGVVLALSPGSAKFVFTDNTTNCVSVETAPITVNEIPVVSLDVNKLCIGFTAQADPAVGGTWSSADDNIAEIGNDGVVTAIGEGTVTLTFVNTNTNCTNTVDITINPTPIVEVKDETELCIGEFSSLTPTTGGVWSVSPAGVASVSNAGIVEAIGAGTAFFTFTSDDGCASVQTEGIIVNGAPSVIIEGPSEICVGNTTTLLPNSGGIWTSNAPAIAEVDANTGVVTGIAVGSARFTFVDGTTGCSSQQTNVVTVIEAPVTNLEDSNICIGQTTSISPSVGGSWASSDTTIARINNIGLITGVSPGDVTFIFTNLAECSTPASATLTVDAGMVVGINDTELCIDETAQLTPDGTDPATLGTWVSSNDLVAEVTDAGLVTAIAEGFAYFVFKEAGTGCESEHSDTILVQPKPTVIIAGTEVICINGSTTLFPDGTDAATLGTWQSLNPGVASVLNDGTVTGITTGTATFVFTLTATSCPSDPTLPVDVSPTPVVEIKEETQICIGATTTVGIIGNNNVVGTWSSSDETVAKVNNLGLVIGVAPGVVNFTFTETATGCSSSASTGDLTVTQCIDPDFNVTYVNVPVPGDVSTNDSAPAGITYGNNYTTTSSPTGSIVQLTVNPDGTYTFEGNLVGEYVFEVPACVAPKSSGCETAQLTISVLDYSEPTNRPVANVDIATTDMVTPVIIFSLDNDRCVVIASCDLDNNSVTVTTAPQNGAAIVNNASGDITYTPNAGFTGIDTLEYQVCVVAEPANCATAYQIITVNSPTALNSTVAADDFGVTPQETVLTGDVSVNDNDVEGDIQTITAQNVTVDAGTLVLSDDGSYTFTPAPWFFGPVDFAYTTTDDNANPVTADATLHILVVRDLTINVRVYLEGALINSRSSDKGTTHDRKLMTDHLRNSPFTGANYIPNQDPYTVSGHYVYEDFYLSKGNFVQISFRYNHIGIAASDSIGFVEIDDPTTVFGVTGENAVTDWVFVELRDKNDNENVIANRSGLVQRDGDVVDLDGVHGLRFPGLVIDDYYVVVRHRSHLGTMTAVPQTPEQYFDVVDFTLTTVNNGVVTANMQTYDAGDLGFIDFSGLGQKVFYSSGPPVMALWAGDFDQDGKVKYESPGDDLQILSNNVKSYSTNLTYNSNFDFAYGYLNSDIDMNGKSKHDNPADDHNILSIQVKYHIKNLTYKSNFDFVREQLPERF